MLFSHNHNQRVNIFFPFYRLLLLGVCRVIQPSGPLDGLLGGRFLTAFAACLFTILSKGVLIAMLAPIREDDMTVNEKTTFVLILFLPPLFIAVLTTIGFTRDSLKIFVYKPELIIMPTGTY